jgi:transcriptional regulator with XRE-family HTH domain
MAVRNKRFANDLYINAVVRRTSTLVQNTTATQMPSDNQDALGERLGITFQQVQKYENGRNRVIPRLLGSRCLDASAPSALCGL